MNGTIPQPIVGQGTPPITANDVAVWDDKDEAAFGAISLRIAHHMQAAILTAANTTSALVWMAITTMWSWTGISAIYQDYKAVMRIRVGMSNPAKDITCLQTHFECLSANNAPVSAYEQGMILLSAIPDEWDHVAAYYVQTCTRCKYIEPRTLLNNKSPLMIISFVVFGNLDHAWMQVP